MKIGIMFKPKFREKNGFTKEFRGEGILLQDERDYLKITVYPLKKYGYKSTIITGVTKPDVEVEFRKEEIQFIYFGEWNK